MPILSLDDYIASAKQVIPFTKTTAVTTVATTPFTVFDRAGAPGAGTVAGASTTAGVVPVHTDAGYPALNTFASGAKGYLSRLAFTSTVAGRMALYDRVFLAGAYAFGAGATVLTGQPSYLSRIPNADYEQTELWVECTTAYLSSTVAPTVTVTYTNQAGVTGRTTGAVSWGVTNPTIYRMQQLPLQAGDLGITAIESVTVAHTGATAGAINVMVLRKLWEGRVPLAGYSETFDMLKTGLPEIPQTAALFPIITPDSTSSGVPYFSIEIANK